MDLILPRYVWIYMVFYLWDISNAINKTIVRKKTYVLPVVSTLH